jgi:hypothetical protein
MRDFLESIVNACFRHWIWIFAILGLGGVAAGTYYFTTQGPHQVGPGGTGILRPDDPKAVDLSAEVDALYGTFQAGTDQEGLASTKAVEALVQATEKQRELVRLLAGPARAERNRLGLLETDLVDQQTQKTSAKVRQLEADGRSALDAGKMEEAGPKLAEALRLQRGINQGGGDDRLKDSKRESEIQHEVATVEADAVHREYLAARALAAQPDLKPDQARAAYLHARELQERINVNYPNTTYVDVMAIQEIDVALDSLKSDTLRQESGAAESAGDQALAQGDAKASTADYLQARDLQAEINQTFKLSHWVSAEREEALDVKWQSSASIPTLDRLATLERAIADLLRRRQTREAGMKVAEAAPEIERLATIYPKSQRLNQALREKLAYLAAHREDLGAMQTLVFEHLLPVPGRTGRWLWKTPVTQALYTKVTGATPSRFAGEDLPVEAVTWTEAEAFCERLSWALGQPVRLPEEAEYRAALGSDGQPATWNLENSHESTQPVGRLAANAAGFCDLLGDVAEWLAAPPEASEAAVVGGSYLDPATALPTVPIEARPKDDRARTIGFRFVVELPAGAPLPTAQRGSGPAEP